MNSISRKPEETTKEISAGFVFFREESDGRKYLLLRHANGGHWSFPKGHLEEGESAREAAVRELREETGLKPGEIRADFRERVHYSHTREDERIEKSVIYFLASVGQFTKVSLTDEHLDYEWVSFGKGIEKLTYDNDVQVLRKAEEELEADG